MARFNSLKSALPSVSLVGTIRSELSSSTTTALGGAGYARDPESELFLLGVTNMVGQDSHHEDALSKDGRYADLIKQLAPSDAGLEFLRGFLPWLRKEAGLRTAPFVGAVHAVAARRGLPDDKHVLSDIVADTLQRADEPGEAFAFWDATYGGQHPKALKRGAAKAIVRLYTERSALRWDTPSKVYRFGRMLDLTHPKLGDVVGELLEAAAEADRPVRSGVVRDKVQVQRDLFGFLGKRMRGKDQMVPESLTMFRKREQLDAIPPEFRRTFLANPSNWEHIRASGMSWQQASSWLNGPLDAKFWAAMIPSMAPQALLMNLRNFDQAGIDDDSVEFVCGVLTDEVRVHQAKIMPLQVLSAYRATADSLNWGKALSRTMAFSLGNLPSFAGKTLIMVDTSTSMDDLLSSDGTLKRWDAAVVFAVALAKRCEDAEVVSFSSSQKFYGDPRGPHTKVFPLKAGEALLKAVDRWGAEGYFLGGGTETAAALRRHVRAGGIGKGHDRVIVITDEQTGVDAVEVSQSVPAKMPMVTLNLAGYRAGHAPAGTRTRVAIGGFNDAAFKLLAAVDRSQGGRWPWMTSAEAPA